MVAKIKAIVEKFCAGEEESAFFNLIELQGDVLPTLAEVFRQETEIRVRAFLVKAAWERRDKAVFRFSAKS
jgi:hypothetical protein